jgi:DeoR family transcriptional regulator, aga operon transcriptional repressor
VPVRYGAVRRRSQKELSREQGQKIPAQRRAELLALLRERGAAPISDLSVALQASESTVRRDLDYLDAEGLVRRTHGGAIILGMTGRTTFEPLFADRRWHNPDEKARIGRLAATLLEDGQSVLFDSSSTVLSVAEAIVQHPVKITAVTNDVNLASVLALASDGMTNIVVPGGEIRSGSFTLLGSSTRAFFERLHVDVAFVGIHAITGTLLTEGGLDIAEVKRAIIHTAERVVLLADHSKFGPPAFFEVARADAVHDLITDRDAPQDALDALRAEASTRIHLA